MAIEKTFERIAVALEKIAAALESKPQQGATADNAQATQTRPTPTVAPDQNTTAPNQAPAPTPPGAAAAPTPPVPPTSTAQPPAPAPTPPPAAASTLTMDQLNEALVSELSRLGGRDPVDKVMREQFQIQSLTQLDQSRYQDLLNAVRAIQV